MAAGGYRAARVGYGRQPVDAPAGALARVAEAVVQPERPALPELDRVGDEQEPAPVRRPGTSSRRTGSSRLGHTPLQRLAVLQHRLWCERPRAELRVARPRGEVRVGLGPRRAARPRPVTLTWRSSSFHRKTRRGVRVLGQLLRPFRLSWFVKNVEAALVDAAQQDVADGRARRRRRRWPAPSRWQAGRRRPRRRRATAGTARSGRRAGRRGRRARSSWKPVGACIFLGSVMGQRVVRLARGAPGRTRTCASGSGGRRSIR